MSEGSDKLGLSDSMLATATSRLGGFKIRAINN